MPLWPNDPPLHLHANVTLALSHALQITKACPLLVSLAHTPEKMETIVVVI